MQASQQSVKTRQTGGYSCQLKAVPCCLRDSPILPVSSFVTLAPSRHVHGVDRPGRSTAYNENRPDPLQITEQVFPSGPLQLNEVDSKEQNLSFSSRESDGRTVLEDQDSRETHAGPPNEWMRVKRVCWELDGPGVELTDEYSVEETKRGHASRPEISPSRVRVR